ncbi:hypothetical protein ACWDYH_18980 [Nocardia goodfellowii]
MRNFITAAMVVLAAFGAAGTIEAGVATADLGGIYVEAKKNCTANDNLGETARKYIERCRKGGINREFPDSTAMIPWASSRTGRVPAKNRHGSY